MMPESRPIDPCGHHSWSLLHWLIQPFGRPRDVRLAGDGANARAGLWLSELNGGVSSELNGGIDGEVPLTPERSPEKPAQPAIYRRYKAAIYFRGVVTKAILVRGDTEKPVFTLACTTSKTQGPLCRRLRKMTTGQRQSNHRYRTPVVPTDLHKSG